MAEEDTEILSLEEVQQLTHKKLGHNDFKIETYSFEPIGEAPAGFNGEHKTLTVTLVVNDEMRKLHFFIKVSPKLEIHKQYLDKIRMFYKEIGAYDTILKDFKNSRKNIGKVEFFHPECYFSKGEDIIVLDDLNKSGYEMYPERMLLEDEYVLASLDTMAAMHASSIIFEDQFNKGNVSSVSPNMGKITNNKNFVTTGELYSHLLFETEASDDPNHPGNTVYEVGIKAQLELVDLLEGYSSEEKDEIKKKLPEEMRRQFQLVKPSEKFKNVIVHGDLWSNNLLFRKLETVKSIHSIIIDFQLVRFAPPAHDVMTFLHLVQNRKYREGNRSRLLQYYYRALSLELEVNDLSLSSIIPWDEFAESCEYYEELGLLTALFFFQSIIVPGKVTGEYLSSPELYFKNMLEDRNEMIKECFFTDDLFKTRVAESMNELIEKYILK